MLSRAANIPPPPSENPQLDQVSPEDRDAAWDDRAEMIGAGLAALTMTYTGLRSFENNAALFGDFGEAAAEPIRGVREFVKEGIRP